MGNVKLRLILRSGIADADGRNCGFNYTTLVIDVPKNYQFLEIVGGEWIVKEEEQHG